MGTVLNRITEVRTVEDGDTVSVVVRGDRLLTYTSVKQPLPPTVLLYFPKTQLADITPKQRFDRHMIRQVNALEVNADVKTTRLEIILSQDMPYEVARAGTGLKISFRKDPFPQSDERAPTQTQQSKTLAMHDTGSKKDILPRAAVLKSISAIPIENGTEISIKADGTITEYTSFPIRNPARIVFDLPEISSPYRTEQVLPVGTQGVKQVRYYQYPDKIRVVLDTTDKFISSFSASPRHDGLAIHVGPDYYQARGAHGDTVPAVAAKTPAAPSPIPEGQSGQPAVVERIDFVSEAAGRSSIIIGTAEPAEYEINRVSSNRLLLQLFNTRLPGYRQRPLITTRFESAVNRIIPVQTPDMKDAAHFIIELREAVPYFVEKVGNALQIRFEASTISPPAIAAADLPPWQQVLEESIGIDAVLDLPAEDGGITPYTSAARYTGEKIALDFYETDIKNVFRILRKISGKNFAIDDDVEGEVTLAIDKPVPWDQVLDLILKMNQLGKVEEGDIIRIAALKTLGDEEDARQKKEAEQQQLAEEKKALEPLLTEYIPVSYSNAAEIEPHIVKILTEGRGSVSVDVRSNLIIVTDVASKIEETKRLVHRLDEVTPQVIIQARIVEATTSFSREIGTEWSALGGIQPGDAAVGVGPQRGYDVLGGTHGWDAAMNFPASITGNLGSTVGFNFTRIAGSPLLLNAKLRAMETQGQGEIVSAPKIVTLDNKTATIKQGLEYPYLELDKDGNATRKFKDIDLSLEVTPHVTPDDRISMTLNITKNDVGAIINGEQSFTTKEAQTELLVNDGETIVIGGIIKTTKNRGESGLPGASKIPVLGWLFKSESNSSQKEELLIFITPKIVQLEQKKM